jgi:undecaprenyl-diphosphatase
VLGLAFGKHIKAHLFQPLPVATAFIVGGLVILWVERRQRRAVVHDVDDMRLTDALKVGLAQAFALIPGTSRSGATIVGGLVLGFDRETAARFSFLLSIPAVVLSGLFELRDVGGGDGTPILATIIATIFAFISGYASIAFLLRYLARHTLTVFGVYRIIFGLLIFGLVLTDSIT